MEGKTIAVGAACVAVVAGVIYATMESDQDLARKPQLAEDLETISMSVCDIGASTHGKKGYHQRLHDVFMNTRSNTLDFFKDNKITICLDQRLNQEKYGLFETEPDGLYYPDDESPILSLWDNGQDSETKSLLESTAASYGPTYLKAFRDKVGDGWFTSYKKVEDIKAPLMAYDYVVVSSCGKNCTTTRTEYDWKPVDGWGQAGSYFRGHPNLQNPPLQSFVPL